MTTNLEAKEISRNKAVLRDKFRSLKEEQSVETREALSAHISKNILTYLTKHPEWQVIASYKAMPTEANIESAISDCLSAGKTCAFPKVTGETEMEFYSVKTLKDFRAGAFGIEEPDSQTPVAAEDIDCIFIPALAFDHEGNRLGQGKAYYDRFLGRTSAKKIGVGFSFQMSSEALPEGPFDVKMDAVITDKAVLEMKRESL
jgi:5-formyltetrahydrofolate cyclo-ligase